MSPLFSNGAAAAVYAAAALGFRHGLESHQLAAIGDFISTARSSRRAATLVALYTCSHILTIGAIGAASVAFGLALPKPADTIAERAIGLTLLLFGGYVLYSFSTDPGKLARHSRFTLIISLFRWFRARNESGARLAHNPETERIVAVRPAFALGVIHGIGLETPTQLAVFVLAGGIGGYLNGIFCVAAFLAALTAMTGVLTICSIGLLSMGAVQRWIHSAVMLAAGTYSLVLGGALVLGLMS